jgi:hypothetical protein
MPALLESKARTMNWRTSINSIVVALFAGMLLLFATRSDSSSSLWNQGWRFHLGDTELNSPDAGWEKVSLPHTPRIEHPFPGPFENLSGDQQEIKVWPANKTPASYRNWNRRSSAFEVS